MYSQKNTKLKYYSPNESSVTQKQCLALYHSFTYFQSMKQKVISLTAESFVCRCHRMYLLVLRVTSGVLYSAGMEWSLPLPDSYMSTRAANPESNVTSTDDPILLQAYHCALPTPHPETVISLY